jgi:hypothetical protein
MSTTPAEVTEMLDTLGDGRTNGWPMELVEDDASVDWDKRSIELEPMPVGVLLMEAVKRTVSKDSKD